MSAKMATAAVQYLLRKNAEGERNIKKIIAIVGGFIFLLILLIQVAITVMNIPLNALSEFFLPDSIVEFRRELDGSFYRPIIGTDEIGLLPLPVTEMWTSSEFGWRLLWGDINWHEGLDFPVAFDTPVMSVADGVVVSTGVDMSYGTYVKVEHIMILPEYEDENGATLPEERITFYSFYAHLYKSYVFDGDTVYMNQQIGTSGGDPSRHFAGNVTGAHLHFEIRESPEYGSQVDPYDWLLRPLSKEEEKRKRDVIFEIPRKKGEYDY